jgi:methionyl-tRNA formyltransferase
MKAIIVTTDEPFYLPLTIKRLLESSVGGSIKCIVVLPPTAKKRTWKTVIFEQTRLGFLYFVYRSVQFMVFKLLSMLKMSVGMRPHSIEAAAAKHDVALERIYDINADEAVGTIGRYDPDLIISLSASQVFSKRVTSLARWGAINVHNAPLPKYQGLMPSFWVLRYGEPETAVTVHLMDARIDTGDIVVQRRVPISPEDTLDSLIRKTKRVSAKVLLETIEMFIKHKGVPPTMPNDASKATYFGFPTRADVKAFRAAGRKVLWRNIY